MKTQVKYPQKGDRLLIVKYSALGDVVGATSVARCLKDHYPFLNITWFVRGNNASLLEGQPYVDNLLIWPEGESVKGFWDSICYIRKQKFEWLLDLQWVDRSALLTLFSGARFKVGYHKKLGRIYDFCPSDWKDDKPLLQRQSMVVSGLAIHDCHRYSPFLMISDSEKAKAEGMVGDPGKPRILAILGASKEIKTWPVNNWLDLLKKMTGYGWTAVLVGHLQIEREKAAKITEILGPDRVVDLSGKLSLRELAAVASCCTCAVGGDSGPTHLANAVGVPTVALFGPTVPDTVFPAGPNTVVMKSKCPLQGCYNWECENYETCLGSIDADAIIQNLSERGLLQCIREDML